MENVTPIELFFHLLRYAIGSDDDFPYTPTDNEWQEIFDISIKQTLAGIAFLGIEKLPEEKRPPKKLYITWHIACEHIKKFNKKLNQATCAVSNKFREVGFRNVVLKGQGVAQLYPQPLYRQAGDIDIWLEGDRDNIIKYLRSITQSHELMCYHHTDFPINEEFNIEVHFMPSWMNNPLTNKRLQKFFTNCAEREFTNSITMETNDNIATVSTLAFNRIFILQHIYRHLFDEGVGLRQLLDYYMVLSKGFTQEEKKATIETLRQLNMLSFTGATMYVLQEVFGMKKDRMLVEPDIQQGKFFLHEIMQSGNFGLYDSRRKFIEYESLIHRIFRKTNRNLRFIKYHTMEVLCTPIFKTWQYFWRRRKERYYNSKKFKSQ